MSRRNTEREAGKVVSNPTCGISKPGWLVRLAHERTWQGARILTGVWPTGKARLLSVILNPWRGFAWVGSGSDFAAWWVRAVSGFLKRAVRRLPGAQWTAGRLRQILGEPDTPQTRVPPGHFYSPIPSLDFIRERETLVFAADRQLLGIDIDETRHQEFLGEILPMLPDFPFRTESDEGYRYVDNGYFAYFDGFVLHGMMRCSAPRVVIEVGSGYSSALMLDVNQHYLKGRAELLFIEPFADRLRSRLTISDLENPKVQILEEFVQDVPLEFFDRLENNDILFIDSSHVCKTGSDVNFLYFEVLPRLRPGVLIHVHDVHYPFEYPRLWIEQERAWNEVYLLHAFLAYNETFEIVFQCDYARRFLAGWFEAQMPGFLATSERSAAKIKCGSIWLRRR